MEIASVMPCEGAATGAANTSVGAPTPAAFRTCLGSAVDREHERTTAADARTGANTGTPRPRRPQEDAAETASLEAQATDQPAGERPEREPEDGVAAVAPPPTETTPTAVVPALDPTGAVAVDALEPPAEHSLQQPRQQTAPPQGRVAAHSTEAGPAPAVPSAAGATPAAATAPQQPSPSPELQSRAAAPSVSERSAATRNDALTAVSGSSLSSTKMPQRPTLPAASPAESAETPAQELGGQDPETLRNRLGAARLWGYWLRNGSAAPGGGILSQLAAEGEPGRPPGGATSSPWAVRLDVAADATTAGAIATEAGGGRPADARFETPAPASLSGLGSGSAQGPERAGGVTAPPARAAAPPPEPPQQVANAVRLAVLRGGDRVTVQMEPAALGKVHVELIHGSDGVRASFRVENPLTHQALQADAPQLKQALEARGVNVAFVSVELDQGDQRGRDPLARHTPGRRRRFGGEDAGEIRLEDLPLRPEAWRPWGFEARA